MQELDRQELGRLVRDAWIAWAKEQQDSKPHWLDSWENLSETIKEVDRRIGETVATFVVDKYLATKWIKTWELIDDKKTYLVLAANRSDEGKELFSHPQILSGWQVKRLFNGCYVAAELDRPKTLGKCT